MRIVWILHIHWIDSLISFEVLSLSLLVLSAPPPPSCHHTHISSPRAIYTFFVWLSLLFELPIFSQLNLVQKKKSCSMPSWTFFIRFCCYCFFFCRPPVNSYSTNLVESNLFDELTMDINGLNFGFMQMKWHWIFFIDKSKVLLK